MVVVRFAPSPTGFLHLGSARTALFNWLYARHAGGKFLLRVEDTDRVRSDKKYLDEILVDLKWMGLDWDSEPLHQSARFDVYKEEARKLLDAGKAYKEGEAFIFKVEKSRVVEVNDVVHGKITFNTDEIKDQVMMKSDGSPAYNFSCVVDDAFMGITHIIRGDDHLSNTPKQVLFYEALGKKPPVFAHIPLMMGKDGSKLSKRHGAVSVEEYRKEGFLPEALANYLLLLGWSPGGDREIIPLDEAVKLFDIDQLKDVQVRFDVQKLRWLNGEYIMKKSGAGLAAIFREKLLEAGVPKEKIDEAKLLKLAGMYRSRVKVTSEFVSMTDCFFRDDYSKDEKAAEKYLTSNKNKELISLYAARLEKLSDFTAVSCESECRLLAEEKAVKAADIIHPVRVAISGKTVGAGLFEMMEILGKETVLKRIKFYTT